jgi:hypothetical protein
MKSRKYNVRPICNLTLHDKIAVMETFPKIEYHCAERSKIISSTYLCHIFVVFSENLKVFEIHN